MVLVVNLYRRTCEGSHSRMSEGRTDGNVCWLIIIIFFLMFCFLLWTCMLSVQCIISKTALKQGYCSLESLLADDKALDLQLVGTDWTDGAALTFD